MRMHWRGIARLKKEQRQVTLCCMIGKVIPSGPHTVTITRYGPRKLDDDNLASACKYVRDQVAEVIGVDDGSTSYTWRYEQQVGKYGVDVEILTREVAP